MKALSIRGVILPSAGERIELGRSPAGFITVSGDLYTYDNYFAGTIPAGEKVIFIDEGGIISDDPETVEEFFCCADDYTFDADIS